MITAIIARVKDKAPLLRYVGGALDLAQLQKEPPTQRPAAYVVTLGSKASPREVIAGAHRQMTEATFAIVFCIGAEGTKHGASKDAIATITDPVLAGLLAWKPAADMTGCEFIGDGLLQPFGAGVVWWRQEYSTRFILQATP